MRTIILDGARLNERETAMDILTLALDLPEEWGRNLDALHDCLTEVGQPTRVEVVDCGALEGTVFGQGLLRVLEDTAWENPCFELEEL
jgi:ribonuclease inhibitor